MQTPVAGHLCSLSIQLISRCLTICSNVQEGRRSMCMPLWRRCMETGWATQ